MDITGIMDIMGITDTMEDIMDTMGIMDSLDEQTEVPVFSALVFSENGDECDCFQHTYSFDIFPHFPRALLNELANSRLIIPCLYIHNILNPFIY